MQHVHASAKARTAPLHAVRRNWALGSLLAAGAAAAALTFGALAGFTPGSAHAAPGVDTTNVAVAGAMDGHHHHGHHHGMHGLPFGGRHLDRMLNHVDATPAQRQQIKPITDRAAADLKAMHQEAITLHEQGLKLWAAPLIDAAAAEKLRQQMVAHNDKVSKRMLQATLDIGHVLTPEQRVKLADHMKKRHDKMKDRMQRHHRHHGGPDQGASAPRP